MEPGRTRLRLSGCAHDRAGLDHPRLEEALTLLYAETLGSGEPLLLLHGGFASLESLRPLAVALSGDFEVHMYERPGHGRTPDRPGPYSYVEMVLDALAHLDAAGLGAVHVVGFSDGANIALMLALGIRRACSR